MLFFTRSSRPRSRRSPSAIRAHLGVEQLEPRLALRAMSANLEMLINTTTSGVQQTGGPGASGVAIDSSGDAITTWQSANQDGSGWGIYGQGYNTVDGTVGKEFKVNTTTAGDQQDPSAAMDSYGDFVMVWSSYGQDGSGWGVYGQRYNAAGAVGSEFRVNTTTAGDQQSARVGMDAQGNFTVVWSSNGQDGSGWGIYGQRYSAAGAALGSEFRVNTTTAGDQEYASIAMNGTGTFVVTWSSYGQDGSGWGVYGQRYSAAGLVQGSEFRVNTTTASDQMYSSVAMDAAGDYIIAWSSFNQDGSGWGVYGQRYSAAGLAQGGEFRVNTTTAGDQMYSAVAMDSKGNFTITWQSNGQDGAGWGTYRQQFTAAGAVYGSETLVNTTTAGDQTNCSLAMTPTGLAITLWSGNGSGDSSGVFGKQSQLL